MQHREEEKENGIKKEREKRREIPKCVKAFEFFGEKKYAVHLMLNLPSKSRNLDTM